MDHESAARVVQLLSHQESSILKEWLALLRTGGTDAGRVEDAELQVEARRFLELLRKGLDSGVSSSEAFAPLRELLADISRKRVAQGFLPSQTAMFVFALKQPLFNAFSAAASLNPIQLMQMHWQLASLLDELGLYAIEVFQKSRDEIIIRQQREISELSTPVVKLWDGILALPIIGTLDSERTQVVMENLLQSIVEEGAEIAIIDITGVPTVDTLTAQHLLKTVAAARLMGADCIISGIRPQIAQTMVHLGVELNVISKATLADAFAVALRRRNRGVVTLKTPMHAPESTG